MDMSKKIYKSIIISLVLFIAACNTSQEAMISPESRPFITLTVTETMLPTLTQTLITPTLTPTDTQIPSATVTPTLKEINTTALPDRETKIQVEGIVPDVTFSPDRTMIALGGYSSGEIIVWDLINWDEINRFPAGDWLTTLAFSPDGNHIAYGNASGGRNQQTIIAIKNIYNGEIITDILGFTRPWDLVFTPDGSYLVMADLGVSIFDVASNELVNELETEGPGNSVGYIAISPDGKHIITGNHNGVIAGWDLKSGEKLYTFQGANSPISALALSPDGKFIAYVAEDNDKVLVWDLDLRKPFRMFLEEPPIYSLAFSSAGDRLATGTEYNVNIWDMNNGAKVCTLLTNTFSIMGIAFSSDDRMISSGSIDGVINSWSVARNCDIQTK